MVTRADDVNEAVRAVHTAFGLDSDSDEAVVYGGHRPMTARTGRSAHPGRRRRDRRRRHA